VTTPAEWRRRAAEYDAKAKAAAEAGDQEEVEVWVRATLSAQYAAEEMERQEQEGRLPQRGQRGNRSGMLNAARVRMSAGADETPDNLVAKANAAGYTLRSLAEAVKCSHALLSQARRGIRSIRREIVEDVERLTGFKATRANWPGGIRD
jgi:hypothetical protein